MQKYLASFALFLTLFSGLVIAQEGQQPAALETYKPQYQAEWTSLVSQLAARTDLSFPQKLVRYEREVTGLKAQFVVERAKEYQNLAIKLTADHQCKGRPSGTPKNCGFVCVERPNDNMYTTEQWTSYTGDSMGDIKNEAKACLKLEVRGKGKKQGSVSAIFKFRTSYIDYKVADDADALFNSFLTE
jgi:hypothetical protein